MFEVFVEVVWFANLYVTHCDAKDYNPPGSSVYRISQARILERVARGSSQARDRNHVSCTGR